MFLQRLLQQSHVMDDLGPSMYKPTPVRYEVQLNSAGKGLGIITLSSGAEGKRDRGKEMFVPSLVRPGTAAKPLLLADRGDYALGIGEKDTVARNHAAFIDLIEACATATDEPSLGSVLAYLRGPEDERVAIPEDYDPAATVVFSVDGRYPINIPSVQQFWASYAGRSKGGEGVPTTQCLVCGERREVVSRLPYMIKGLAPVGGQSSGTALVSANSDAFTSYGLAENFIAPMCSDCAERVCKTLNALISDERHRLYVGSVLYVFWTTKPTTFQIATAFHNPDPQQVAALLGAARSGRSGALEIDDARFCCVGLAGSGARVAVRDWIDISIADAQANLGRYFQLQQIVNPFGEVGRYFSLSWLSGTTVRDPKKDKIPPIVPRSLMKVALEGGAIPDAVLAQVVRRVQVSGAVTHQQAAVIKMVLTSRRSDAAQQEDFMVQLDQSSRDPAYLCGRLLAVLDDIQRAALGERNATIIDRFFGSASTTPIAVFGRLLKGASPHLGKLRRDRPGTYRALDARLQEIMSQLGEFPRVLTLQQQGRFVLGFYHQKAEDTRQRNERAEARKRGETVAADEVETEAQEG